MIRKIVLLPLFMATIFIAQAQQVRPANATQVYHEISQLRHLTHVLYLAAHPDDENTRFLAWMVNQKHIRTAYLSLTRGDGGQNILGSEQGASLGLIRTHELMEARKLDGAEQFFTRFVDFGFSKNSTETFKHWNEYILTHDVTYVIRKFRPDVIICRFPPTAQAGHGQHAVSAIIAEKAFKAAGDKAAYTEEFQYVQPWQAKRLLFNAFRFGSFNTTSEDMYKVEVGQYNPMLGMGYGELAGISRSIHKSQGAGTPSVPGVQKEYFKVVAGDSISESLFDGIDITWNRVGRKEIGDHIGDILKAYDFKHPEKSLAALIELRKEIVTVKDDFWRTEKLEALDQLILHASGFMAELYTAKQMATDGSTLPFTLNLITRSGSVDCQLKSIQWNGTDTMYNLALKNDSLFTFTHTITIPANAPVTQPYWMKVASTNSEFAIPEDTLLGMPEAPNNLYAIVTISIAGTEQKIHVPLSYKKLDPIKGDVVEQLLIVPDASVEIADKLIITKTDGTAQTTVHIHTFKEIKNATLELFNINSKATRTIGNLNFRANADTIIPIKIAPNEFGKDDYFLSAELDVDGRKFSQAQQLIQYNHLPTLQYFTPASSLVLHNNWKVTARKIGYIEGAGDYTATLLRLAGLQVDVLKEADLTDANRLKQYDAIVTGVRAVNVEKRMSYWLPVLHEYVKNGGTLVMQYNTLQDLSTTNIGPYPFTLANVRTTEEDAKVTMLEPQHRLLNYPNKITDADFKDWVQERGLYYPTKYDQYTSLFEMNDTGEDPQKGSTIYAKYGKGNFIYTSLSLFRQLPAGNKGAIRLLMNFISVGK